MKTDNADFILATLISLLLLLLSRSEALAGPTQFQTTVYDTVNNNTLVCHDQFMSIYISKGEFAELPFTIYVQDTDEHSGYYQALAVAKQCNYFLRETETAVVLTVSSRGCFVRRLKHITNVTVVIMARTNRGRVEVVKSIPIICHRESEEVNKNDYPLVSSHFSCTKDGFNITISKNAGVPPLNLETVWIPSSQGHCKPKNRSENAVTFSFSFTECGTQAMIANGIMTYWVIAETKQPQTGSVFRDTPFHFALAKITYLSIKVQGEKPLSTLKSEGLLRTEMRFAKDSSYSFFFSPREPPAVTELGQPVYVEVFVLKHENEDLMLLLEDCWATPTKNPNDPHRWNLLVKGCSFGGDHHRTVVLPVVSSKELKYPSLHKRFVVMLFSFVKPHTFENLVYFHCNIELCKGSNCSQSCGDGKWSCREAEIKRNHTRAKAKDSFQCSLQWTTSLGPVNTQKMACYFKSYLEEAVHNLQ